mgnify:CR=1 FL=1
MINRIQLRLNPEDIHNESLIRKKIVENIKTDEPFEYRFIKRSIDARARKIKLQCTVDIYINEPIPLQSDNYKSFKTNPDKSVTIIGAGPAGLFAALYAISKGVKPVIIERGKKVRNRRRDLAELNKKGIVNPESNYCFGEGGAGTYSDGKLYTRSKKRGDVHTVLSWFVHFGADEDILIDTHPHIGTNKLPKIIEKMREEIIMQGGEIHFNSKMTDLIINNEKIEGIIVNESDKLYTSNLILATGHSARDVLYILNNHQIKLEAKPFALGVRVEHKQELIDKIQEAMLHTNLKGEINWKDGDDIEVQIAGTFAKDKFIVLKNASKNPFENAQPHPHFDYEKKVFTKDGREEYMKEQEELKK